MIVRVHLFARARDLTQSDMLTIEVHEPASVADVRRALIERCPALGRFLNRCAIAVDEDFAADDAIVALGAQIAVIPPVSGG